MLQDLHVKFHAIKQIWCLLYQLKAENRRFFAVVVTLNYLNWMENYIEFEYIYSSLLMLWRRKQEGNEKATKEPKLQTKQWLQKWQCKDIINIAFVWVLGCACRITSKHIVLETATFRKVIMMFIFETSLFLRFQWYIICHSLEPK